MTNDSRQFRNALGTFATGITVVTTYTADKTPVGLTVNSFASVSLDPKLVLFSLQNDSRLNAIFAEAKGFCINVLSHQQEDVSNLFASSKDDKFSYVDWQADQGPFPQLQNCLATFQCQTAQQIAGGDHTIYLGEVENFTHQEGTPLLYFNGSYRTL